LNVWFWPPEPRLTKAGEYTFYSGEKPENIVGTAVEAASELSIIIVRIDRHIAASVRDNHW
jgi:hypothetical protein